MDEHKWIRDAKRGDADAFARLMHNHYAYVLKYLRKVTMQPQLAEDLTQETMIRMMERFYQYDGRAKLSSWLVSIASRLYLDHLRKRHRERAYAEDASQAMRALRWQTETRGDEWPLMLDRLAELPPAQRIPLVLKHYYGYAQYEIAEMMGIPEGTVKSRIHTGIERLRKEWNEHA